MAKILDSGFRRKDDIEAEMEFFKGLDLTLFDLI